MTDDLLSAIESCPISVNISHLDGKPYSKVTMELCMLPYGLRSSVEGYTFNATEFLTSKDYVKLRTKLIHRAYYTLITYR